MLKSLRALVLVWPCACHEFNPRFTAGDDMSGSGGPADSTGAAATTGTGGGTTGQATSSGETGSTGSGTHGGSGTTSSTGTSTTTDTTDTIATFATFGESGNFSCGDGILDPGEECDGGAANSFDGACLPFCETAYCGDTFVQIGFEFCDDGDFVEVNSCNQFCLPTPMDIALDPGDDTPLLGSPEGNLYSDDCPVLIGFSGIVNSQIGPVRLGGICGELEIAVVDGTFVVKVSSTGEALPIVGGDFGFEPWVRMCPTDHVLTGVLGKSSGDLSELVFRCAPLVITANLGIYTLAVGPTIDLTPVGPEMGVQLPDACCTADQIASGQRIWLVEGITGFGLSCKTPALLGVP